MDNIEELKADLSTAIQGVKTLETKFGETASLVKQFQETNEQELKKHDALYEEKMKKLGDAVTELTEAKQKVAQLETAFNRIAIGTEKDSKGEVITPEMKQYGNLINGYIRKGINELELGNFEKKTLSVGSDPDGGYFVSPQLSNRIVTRMFETSPIRALATIENISTDSFEILSDHNTGVSGGWTGETSTRSTTSTPQIGKITIPTREQYAMPAATQKLLEDAAVDVESWLARKSADILSRTENTAFVSGTGVAQPTGFLSYTAWTTQGTYEYGKIEQRNSGANGSFTFDNLIDLQQDLKEIYRRGAVWLMKRSTLASALKLKNATTNEYLLNDLRTINGTDFNLLGNPVKLADDMPVAATNSLSIAFGDFGAGYTIVDRVGISVLRDPFSSKPNVLFYTRKRVGGGVVDFDAIKLLKLST